MAESKEEEFNTGKDAPGSGIQVFLRIRPSPSPSRYFHRDDIDTNKIAFKVPKQDETFVNNSRSIYTFQFNGILDDNSNQKDVFKTVGIPAVQNALAGYNSTIFAYGQTGSGKTFTITGGPEKYEDRGIIPRVISHLFKSLNNGRQEMTYSCFISYLEIYNQCGYDLLMETDTKNSLLEEIPKVTMLEDEVGNFHFKNLSMHMVSSEEDALNLLFLGDTNRAIAATEMNQNSTRSHCIFTLLLEGRKTGADTVTRSKLNVVDLAGSERVSRTSSVGQTLREAKYINSSLFFLEMVIVALHEKEKKKKEHVHIPYRNSMMTSVLRDSLGGNCKTIMIATISPEVQHTDESISTCNFAQRVALVKNKAHVNEDVEPQMVIQRLRAEVRRLREEVEFLSGKNDDDSSCDENEHGMLPQHQLNELNEACQKYVKDSNESSHLDFCGGITLPKIRAVCKIFKGMIRVKSNIHHDRNDSADDSSEGTAEMKGIYPSDPKSTPHTICSENQSTLKCHEDTSVKQSNNRGKCSVSFVGGVPPCREAKVLDEPNLAFSWFKCRYPGLAAINDNKIILSKKYAEAKISGSEIEKMRSRISHHKEQIEKIRKDHAIRSVAHPEGKISEDDLEYDERPHREAIESEKAAYKSTLEHLRKLKGIIEHVQQLVEKGNQKLQSDFDLWYHQMCNHEQFSNDSGQIHREKIEESKGVSQCSQHEPQRQIASQKRLTETDSGINDSTVKKLESEIRLPPGIKLTGNKEADDDIMAFFRAKEVLLSRTSVAQKKDSQTEELAKKNT